MELAELALSQIKALRHPAYPRVYEVWYIYAAGHDRSFNQAIQDLLALNGRLTVADLDVLYDTHLSPQRVTDRVDKAGTKAIDEFEAVGTVVDSAIGSSRSHSSILEMAISQLHDTVDTETVHAIAEVLLARTADMAKSYHSVMAQLQTRKDEIAGLKEGLDEIRREARLDPLTSMLNRRHFDQALVEAVGYAHDNGEGLSLMMADVDHFKTFNDRFGHLTGDQVLRLVASAIRQNTSGRHVAGRFGGDEFALFLPTVSQADAQNIADTIRGVVAKNELMKRSSGETLGRVTLSVGIALLRDGDTPTTLVERADACLYTAKREGRDQVVCEAASPT